MSSVRSAGCLLGVRGVGSVAHCAGTGGSGRSAASCNPISGCVRSAGSRAGCRNPSVSHVGFGRPSGTHADCRGLSVSHADFRTLWRTESHGNFPDPFGSRSGCRNHADCRSRAVKTEDCCCPLVTRVGSQDLCVSLVGCRARAGSVNHADFLNHAVIHGNYQSLFVTHVDFPSFVSHDSSQIRAD